MEILNRVRTPDEDEDPDDLRLYPCQFCNEMFDDEDILIEIDINLITDAGKVTRHVHATCVVDAAKKIQDAGLDLDIDDHMDDISDIDSVLATV